MHKWTERCGGDTCNTDSDLANGPYCEIGSDVEEIGKVAVQAGEVRDADECCDRCPAFC